jgi:hypothetical protein
MPFGGAAFKRTLKWQRNPGIAKWGVFCKNRHFQRNIAVFSSNQRVFPCESRGIQGNAMSSFMPQSVLRAYFREPLCSSPIFEKGKRCGGALGLSHLSKNRERWPFLKHRKLQIHFRCRQGEPDKQASVLGSSYVNRINGQILVPLPSQAASKTSIQIADVMGLQFKLYLKYGYKNACPELAALTLLASRNF